MTDHLNDIEKELLESVTGYRDQLKEESDSDTLALLEPIMQRLGIMPKDIRCDEQGRWLLLVPSMQGEDRWEYLGDSYAIAIVRDAAEDYLLDLGWEIGRRGRTAWWIHSISAPRPTEPITSLYGALEFAEKMGESQ